MKWLDDLVAWFAGLFGGSGKPTVKCPAWGAPGTIRGVGCDYNWMTLDHDVYYKLLAENGCNGQGIEFFGWSGTYNLARGLEPLKGPYMSAIKAARKCGGVLFVSLCNDNQGQGKYGDRRKPWSSHAGLAEQALQFIIAQGPANVIVQPVSETQTGWGSGFERSAMAKLNGAGFETCYNHGSRPTAPGAGSDRNAYHPFKMEDVGTADDVIVTDTGTILNALQEGGVYGVAFNDARVSTYAKRIRAAGQRDLLIYGFTGIKTADVGAMKAIGDAWR